MTDNASSTQASRPPKPANGLAVTALVLGASAVVLAFVPFISLLAGLLALAALILGIIVLAVRKGNPVLGGVGLGLGMFGGILSIVMGITYASVFFNSLNPRLSVVAPSGQTASASGSTPASAPQSEVGTRENPAPLGTTVSNAEWQITLGPSVLDAGQAVAEANMFNNPAPEGMEYALVPVTATYTGKATGIPSFDISVSFVSAAGTTHKPYDFNVVEPEPRLGDVNELYPGATGSGNVVIAIPIADAASGTWVVSTGFGGQKYFFRAQ